MVTERRFQVDLEILVIVGHFNYCHSKYESVYATDHIDIQFTQSQQQYFYLYTKSTK